MYVISIKKKKKAVRKACIAWPASHLCIEGNKNIMFCYKH